MDREWLHVYKRYKLNERHYGALQGLNQAETAVKYGDEQVQIWRRSYSVRPPRIEDNNKYNARKQEQYRGIPKDDIPMCESLQDTVNRVVPYYESIIKPQILNGKRALITAHGNSLRALVKYFENISDEDIVNVEIPTGKPLVYEFDDNMRYIKHYYL